MSSINPLLLPIKKDNDTIKKTVLENIINMLNKRKWISNENLKKQIKLITENQNDEQVYKISLDVDLKDVETYYPVEDTERKFDKDFNGKYVIVKLLPQNVTSIGKSPIIGEFLSTYNKFHRLIVVDEITEKVRNTLLHSNKHLEILKEEFLMIDLLEHYCSPKYEVLTPAEVKEFVISYNTPRRNLQFMLDSDPASMYLFLEKGQIVRVIRYSEVSGIAVIYRIVVHKKS